MDPTQAAVRRRILIVEDDPDAALYSVHVLGRQGRLDITHADDPVIALALVAEQPWDLVITDLHMPGMSGLELLAALRGLAPALPVLLLTASAPDALPITASDPDGILFKPVPPEQLIAVVATLLGEGRRPAGPAS